MLFIGYRKVPLTPRFFLFKKSTSFLSTGVWIRNLYVHDRAKWDLGRATSDVTSGTELTHSRDFRLRLEGCQTFFGYLWFIFYRNRARFLRKRTVSSSIIIWSLATIWATAMCIYFFPFEVLVARGDCRVVIFARITNDNLPVHLGYNGTSNSSRVNLQLLKSYKDANGHEKSVSWL